MMSPAATLDIVLGADRDRRDLLLRPDDMLQRGAKLRRQLSVRHEDHADHSGLAAGAVP